MDSFLFLPIADSSWFFDNAVIVNRLDPAPECSDEAKLVTVVVTHKENPLQETVTIKKDEETVLSHTGLSDDVNKRVAVFGCFAPGTYAIEVSEGFSSDAWDTLDVFGSDDYSASISSSSDGSTTSYWLDIY